MCAGQKIQPPGQAVTLWAAHSGGGVSSTAPQAAAAVGTGADGI